MRHRRSAYDPQSLSAASRHPEAIGHTLPSHFSVTAVTSLILHPRITLGRLLRVPLRSRFIKCFSLFFRPLRGDLY